MPESQSWLLAASLTALLVATGCKPSPEAAARRQPILDMHLHAFGTGWVNYFKDTSWFPPLPRPASNDSLREQSLRLLEQFNIVLDGRALRSAPPDIRRGPHPDPLGGRRHWSVENFLERQLQSRTTHGICDGCARSITVPRG